MEVKTQTLAQEYETCEAEATEYSAELGICTYMQISPFMHRMDTACQTKINNAIDTDIPLSFEERCPCYLQVDRASAMQLNCKSMPGKTETINQEYAQCEAARDEKPQLLQMQREGLELRSESQRADEEHSSVDRALDAKRPPPPPPTPRPTKSPTRSPTRSPTPSPTPNPTPSPTPAPTPDPTPSPTPSPTPYPTPYPTPFPTPAPTTTTTSTTTSYTSTDGLNDEETKQELDDEREDIRECAGWCHGKKHNDKPWHGQGGRCGWAACQECPECDASSQLLQMENTAVDSPLCEEDRLRPALEQMTGDCPGVLRKAIL